MKIDSATRKRREKLIYVLAAVLMFIRVDLWWWGRWIIAQAIIGVLAYWVLRVWRLI